MPSRVIRGEINASESLARVSPEAELVFRALLLAVDDYGRHDARPAALKGALFPMRDGFTPKKIAAWIDELASVSDPPLRVYEADGRRWVWLTKWEKHRGKQKRGSVSKCPEPPRISAESPEIRTSDDWRVTNDEWRLPSDAAPAAPVAKDDERAPEISEEARTLTKGFLDSRAVPFPEMKPPTPTAYATWEREMDRLLRLDSRTPTQVVDLVRWLFDPSPRASPDAVFWRSNVLAVPKLRAEWDRLQARKSKGAANGKQTVADAAENLVRRFTEFERERSSE